MSQAIPASDATYRAIEDLARQQGTTSEALAQAARGENKRYDSLEAFFAALDEGLPDGESGE